MADEPNWMVDSLQANRMKRVAFNVRVYKNSQKPPIVDSVECNGCTFEKANDEEFKPTMRIRQRQAAEEGARVRGEKIVPLTPPSRPLELEQPANDWKKPIMSNEFIDYLRPAPILFKFAPAPTRWQRFKYWIDYRRMRLGEVIAGRYFE